MADLLLKVNPEQVREKATQISQQRAQMEEIMTELQTKVNLLSEYFKSESGQAYTEKYTNLSRNIKASLDAVMKHVTNLNDAANTYDSGEHTQKVKADNLSTKNIF